MLKQAGQYGPVIGRTVDDYATPNSRGRQSELIP
jgi:hypothetical protein